MIVSLLYKVARKPLSVPGVLLRRDAAKDAELFVLRHENAVLRRQIVGPVRYEPADRFWMAALSGLIPRPRWPEVFPITPGTLLAWHRKFIAGFGRAGRRILRVLVVTGAPLPERTGPEARAGPRLIFGKWIARSPSRGGLLPPARSHSLAQPGGELDVGCRLAPRQRRA